jgi:fermentation-respiration switch protein FrsA (DUF1100 family)
MIAGYIVKIGLVIAILFLGFLFLRYFEKKNIYFPLRTIEATPEEIHLDYENISVKTRDGVQISGWYVPSKYPRVTLLFFHGNGGNISHRLDKIKILNDLDVDVLIFDYRGYGMSGGSPSENGLYLDAEAVYDYLVHEKKTSPGTIIVYGESLGGAVAVDLAGKRQTGGVILEGCFTSVPDMAKRLLPFIPSFLISSQYDSLRKIKDITTPKLLFHSIEDDIVPFALGMKLFQAAIEPKKFVEMRGGHNDAFLVSHDIYKKSINAFIDRL